MNVDRNSGLCVCVLINFRPEKSRLVWRCRDVVRLDCLRCKNSVSKAEWTFGRETENLFGWASGTLQSLRDFLGDFFGDFLRDFLRDFLGDFLTEVSDRTLDIRIADFKGCVLLPLLLLLFEKPSAAGQDPEITFANSFRGSLEMCTNRRPFKSAKVKTFSNFHAVSEGPHQQTGNYLGSDS